MPNGTYGGVRGRKTKAGGKLTTFVFLLLDYKTLNINGLSNIGGKDFNLAVGNEADIIGRSGD